MITKTCDVLAATAAVLVGVATFVTLSAIAVPLAAIHLLRNSSTGNTKGMQSC